MRKFLALMLLVAGALMSVHPVEAAAFYRGFELTSSIQVDEMGYAPTNALLISGKKRLFKKDFLDLVSDLGGVNNAFAPRDPVQKSIVYVSTNHRILQEGGQTGVFIAWKYNIDNGTYARLASFFYDLEDAPVGYSIIGNEGTKLVVLKNIDGPYCTRDIPQVGGGRMQAIDMRAPAKGFSLYLPSDSLRAVFRALPVCALQQQEPQPIVSTTANILSHSRTVTSIAIRGEFSGISDLTGSRMELYRYARGTVPGLNTEEQTVLIKTCQEANACAMTEEVNTTYAEVRYYTVFVGADGERITSGRVAPL